LGSLIVSCRPLNDRALHLVLEVPQMLHRRYHRRVELDILFTVSDSQFAAVGFDTLPPEDAKPLFCCFAQEQVEYVQSFVQKDARVRDAILLAKLWRVQALLRRIPRLKSYLMEILVIHAYVTKFENRHPGSWTLKDLFTHFLAVAANITALQV